MTTFPPVDLAAFWELLTQSGYAPTTCTEIELTPYLTSDGWRFQLKASRRRSLHLLVVCVRETGEMLPWHTSDQDAMEIHLHGDTLAAKAAAQRAAKQN